jgi:hypothetical protein
MIAVILLVLTLTIGAYARERHANAHVYDIRPRLRHGDYIGPDWRAER